MATDTIDVTPHPLYGRFQRFAETECGSSPLYKTLAFYTAEDPEILALAAQTRSGQPVPNMLFGAVHYLLLQGIASPLAAYYPDLTTPTASHKEAYPAFRAFCLQHADSIRDLLKTRIVQTNEVRRCVYLLLGFGVVAARTSKQPLALVEMGCSAGLNLLWDQYRYIYFGAHDAQLGSADSAIKLRCEIKGSQRPPLPAAFPQVASRIGIDLHPVNLSNADDILWLRALIWPEHIERAERIQQALKIAKANPPHMIEGDAVEKLPPVLDSISSDATLCLFHSFTLNQFTPEMRDNLDKILMSYSQQRDIYRITLEWEPNNGGPILRLLTYRQNAVTNKALARCEAHGHWLEWIGG